MVLYCTVLYNIVLCHTVSFCRAAPFFDILCFNASKALQEPWGNSSNKCYARCEEKEESTCSGLRAPRQNCQRAYGEFDFLPLLVLSYLDLTWLDLSWLDLTCHLYFFIWTFLYLFTIPSSLLFVWLEYSSLIRTSTEEHLFYHEIIILNL